MSLLLGVLLLASQPSTPSPAAAWTQWGGPQRTFSAPYAGEVLRLGGAEELWRRPLGAGDSAIVTDGETLYTLTSDGETETAVALRAATGERLWSHRWEVDPEPELLLEFGVALHSTPLLGRDALFAVGGTGRLLALRRSDGELLWERQLWNELDGTRLERGYAASPLASGDLVIVPVGGEAGALVAFDQASGEIRWRAGDGAIAYASPISLRFAGRELVVALLDEMLLVVDAGDGAVLAELPLERYRYVNCTSPLFDGRDRLFVNSSDGGRVLRLLAQGKGIALEELWVARSIGSQVGNALFVDGDLYGTKGGSTSYLVGVDGETGEVLWRDRSIGDASLLLAAGRVLALEDDGKLSLLEVSRTEVEILDASQVLSGRVWTPPTLVGDRLYLRDRRQIVALALPPPTP